MNKNKKIYFQTYFSILAIATFLFYSPLAAQVELPGFLRDLEGQSFQSIQKAAYNRLAALGSTGQTTDSIQESPFVKFKRWEWYWESRLQEDGQFPAPDADIQAYKTYQLRAREKSNTPAFTWNNVGPLTQVGRGYWGMGRTYAIALNPVDTFNFWVGAAAGGIWKTSNGGRQYKSMGDNLPYQGVGQIVQHPDNPNHTYLVIADKFNRSMGVYVTLDGGNTWNPSALNWPRSSGVFFYRLMMHPLDPNTLFACTSNGLYTTRNAGKDWKISISKSCTDIAFNPANPAMIYVGVRETNTSSALYKSVDGGETWGKTATFDNKGYSIRLSTTLADPARIAVSASLNIETERRLFMSYDEGQSFIVKSTMPENLVMYLSQTDTSIIYCGYVNIHTSTDGGSSWKQSTLWHANSDGLPEVHADFHYVQHHPRYPHLVYFCNDGGIYQYNESNKKWTELCNTLAIAQFYKIAVSQTPGLTIGAGSQDNGGWFMKAGGVWIHTNGGDAMDQLIDPTNEKIAYTEYWGGQSLQRTESAWTQRTDIYKNLPPDHRTGEQPIGSWVTPMTLNPLNPNTLLIAYKNLYASFNKGNTFIQLTDTSLTKYSNIIGLEVAPSDTNTIYFYRSSTIYRTHDFGKNWTTTANIGFTPTDMVVDPNNAMRLWAVSGGFTATKKVYTTLDAGKTWTNLSTGLPNTPINSIVYDQKLNLLFIGSDAGVFYSDADQIDWKYYGVGLPNTEVSDLDIRQYNRTLYIGTYGRGVYAIPLPDYSAKPKIAFQNPVADTTIRQSDFRVWVKASDEDGKVSHVALLVNGEVVDVDKVFPYTFDLKSMPEGVYTLQALAYDEFNTSSETQVIQLRVESAITNTTATNQPTWRIYPNPVQDLLYLRHVPVGKPLLVLDIQGKVVLAAQSASYLGVASLPAGSYTLWIEDLGVQQFVKHE